MWCALKKTCDFCSLPFACPASPGVVTPRNFHLSGCIWYGDSYVSKTNVKQQSNNNFFQLLPSYFPKHTLSVVLNINTKGVPDLQGLTKYWVYVTFWQNGRTRCSGNENRLSILLPQFQNQWYTALLNVYINVSIFQTVLLQTAGKQDGPPEVLLIFNCKLADHAAQEPA